MRLRGDAAASFAEGDGRLWRLEARPEAAATDPDRSPRTLPASHSSGTAPPSPRSDSPRCALPELCRPPPRPLGQVHRRRCALRGGRGAARRRRRTGAQAGPGECLFQFLCSSNNNISRLEKMVWMLAGYGERLREVGGFVFHQFPTVERLVQVSEQELWEGFGYRFLFSDLAVLEIQRSIHQSFLLYLSILTSWRNVWMLGVPVHLGLFVCLMLQRCTYLIYFSSIVVSKGGSCNEHNLAFMSPKF